MEFITLDMLLSLAGCVAIVGIVTQALKIYFKKTDPIWLNFSVSIIVGLIRIFVLKDWSASGIILGVMNVFVIMFAAAGGYDTVKTIVSPKEAKKVK